MNILVVEDDESLSRLMRQALQEEGYEPTVVLDGFAALNMAKQEWDLVVLDLMIPGVSGLEVCRRLRAQDFRSPILMVTAKDLIEDKVAGLDAGADDYLVKPFHLVELLARVRALLRRTSVTGAPYHVGALILDPRLREISNGTKSIPLSSTEFFLLEYLMKNPGITRSRVEILMHVWKYDFDGNDNVLDVYVSYLRKKLDLLGQPGFITTIRGVGFVVENNE